MRIISHYVLLLAALPLLAASCNKAQEVAAEKSPVTFTVAGEGISVDVETKAAEVTAANLSPINVLAITGTAGSTETTAWSGAFADNGEGQYTATAADRFWPSEGNPGWMFYASNVSMTPAATGPTVAADNSTDVVCSFMGSPAPRSSNTLVFEHILARINDVTVNAAAGYTISNVVITVTPLISGTFNLAAGIGHTDGTGWSATVPGASTTISRDDQLPGVKNNDVWCVPGNYVITAAWTATKGESVQNYSGKTQTVAITGGKQNNLVTTLGGNASEVVFSVTVNPWGTVDVPVAFPTD